MAKKQKLTVADFDQVRPSLSEEQHFIELDKSLKTKKDKTNVRKKSTRDPVFTDLRKNTETHTKQTVKIERDIYKKIRIFCIEKDITFQDFITKLIDDFFYIVQDEDV
jgi:hypothetical protein